MNFLHQAMNGTLILTLICASLPQTAFAGEREDVLKPYTGPSVRDADPSTLKGKVMTGYQGWFNCQVDEATAIFKCTNNPPTSDGVKFLTMNGLPSDFYLRLAGQAGKLLRDEIPLTETVPIIDRPNVPKRNDSRQKDMMEYFNKKI